MYRLQFALQLKNKQNEKKAATAATAAAVALNQLVIEWCAQLWPCVARVQSSYIRKIANDK